MATIKEIAERAGVSIGTVDRVLHNRGMVNADKEALIRSIAKELDYHPNLAGRRLATSKKKIKLLFVSFDSQKHPFFEDVLEGARQKAKELEQYGVAVEFLILNQDIILPEHYVEMPDCMNVDGVAILGIDLPQLYPLYDLIEQQNIPLVFYNTLLEDRNYLAYVGCDYYKSGRLAAGLCALISDEKGKIGILSEGYGNITSYSQRIDGFRQEIEDKYSNMRIISKDSFFGDIFDCYNMVSAMLKEHPQIDTLYIINPGDYSICKATHRASEGRHIKIITNDLVNRQRQMLQDGVISATICQEPHKQGALSLEVLSNYLALGMKPETNMILTELSIHISQNC